MTRQWGKYDFGYFEPVLDPIRRRLHGRLARASGKPRDRLSADISEAGVVSVPHGLTSDAPKERCLLVSVMVDGRAIEFALDGHPTDPVAMMLAERQFPTDRTSELWRNLVRSHHIVVDVGAHLGTYSLPAAATGANVLSLEASFANVKSLEFAAVNNGFTNLRVLHAAAASERGTVSFKAQGPWGHVALAGPRRTSGDRDTEDVEAVVLDNVIAQHGWRHVDFIKLDIEGSEPVAIEGLTRILTGPDAPTLIVEANGHMLRQYGKEPKDILAPLESLGYTCYHIDQGPDRRLTPVDANDLQPECVTDYIAFKAAPDTLEPWTVSQPFERTELVKRILATCEDSEVPHRAYGARLLAKAPAWLSDDESIRAVQRALATDEHEEVRQALAVSQH